MKIESIPKAPLLTIATIKKIQRTAQLESLNIC